MERSIDLYLHLQVFKMGSITIFVISFLENIYVLEKQKTVENYGFGVQSLMDMKYDTNSN